MKEKQITVKKTAEIVNIGKEEVKGTYKVKTQVNPHLFISYIDFTQPPTIRGKKLEIGQTVKFGQVIKG